MDRLKAPCTDLGILCAFMMLWNCFLSKFTGIHHVPGGVGQQTKLDMRTRLNMRAVRAQK